MVLLKKERYAPATWVRLKRIIMFDISWLPVFYTQLCTFFTLLKKLKIFQQAASAKVGKNNFSNDEPFIPTKIFHTKYFTHMY